MNLTPGTRLGRYEIAAPLGAGGMGRVYRARDTALSRDVAVKLMAERWQDRADLRERFRIEAMAVAALNHPHICQVYDAGTHDDTDYIVMELVDGETLAARLRRMPPRADEALRISSELAAALGAAHRAGIVHRDVKPSNVMLTKAGVKLLDFGLARLRPDDQPVEAHGSTITPASITEPGSVLGTWPYMAPEQLRGEPIDARSDVFALGAVIFETFTGRRAFDGATHHDIAAAVLNSDPPPLDRVAPHAPATLARVVARCLRKSPDERWQTAGDVGLALELAADPATAPVASSRSGLTVWVGVAAIAALAIVSAGLLPRGSAPADDRLVRTSIVLAPLQPQGSGGSVLLTNDGTVIVATRRPRGPSMIGEPLLVRYSLADGTVTPIEGAEGAFMPLLSPDGRWLAFGGLEYLTKVPVTGGTPTRITPMLARAGADWGDDGFIVFGGNPGEGLQRVSSDGGDAATIVPHLPEDAGEDYRNPVVLPGSREVLFGVGTGPDPAARVMLADLATGARKEILRGTMTFRYVPGFILYAREGALYAVPFDTRSHVTGTPTKIADSVMDLEGSPEFAANHRGDLVIVPGNPAVHSQRLVLVSLDGTATPVGTPGLFGLPVFSPDGTRIAVMRLGTKNNVWIYDVRRQTFGAATDGRYSGLAWTSDGRLALAQGGPSNTQIVLREASVDAVDHPLTSFAGIGIFPKAWTREGGLIVERISKVRDSDIYLLPPGGQEPQPLIATPLSEYGPRVSPDGKWLSYGQWTSANGDSEVYLQRLDRAAPRLQASVHGGAFSAWSPDSRRLYFRGGTGTSGPAILQVTIEGDANPQLSQPTVLFDNTGFAGAFDLSPDGKTFVMITVPAAATAPLTYIQNWPQALANPQR